MFWLGRETRLASKSIIGRGVWGGLVRVAYRAVARIPGMLITYRSFAVLPLVLFARSASGLVQAIIGGIALAKIGEAMAAFLNLK